MVKNIIACYRSRFGYTQLDLARLLSVSKNTVSNWEMQNYQPSLDAIWRLLRLFGCEFTDLFYIDYENL